MNSAPLCSAKLMRPSRRLCHLAILVLLLHHSPTGDQYAAANGIDLMIAGHTHGGQFFPGTLVAAAIFPFTHGLYPRGPLQVFVSQGAGTFMSRVRLGTSNELNILRLRPTRSL